MRRSKTDFSGARNRLQYQRYGAFYPPDKFCSCRDFARCGFFRYHGFHIYLDARADGHAQTRAVLIGKHAPTSGRFKFDVYANDVERRKQGAHGVRPGGVGFEQDAELAAPEAGEQGGEEFGLEQGFAAGDGYGMMPHCAI